MTSGKTLMVSLPSDFNVEAFETYEDLPDLVLSNHGQGEIERECDFEYKKLFISVFAWTQGKAGQENKHELPPPIDKELYFGNMIVIAHHDNKIVPLTVEMYNQFYEHAYGGFHDIESEDEYSDDGDDHGSDLEGFVVSEADESDYSTNSESDYSHESDSKSEEFSSEEDDEEENEEENDYDY